MRKERREKLIVRQSMRQLANLFGFLRTDEDGELIGVEADYDDEESGNGEGPSNSFVEMGSDEVDENEVMGGGGEDGYGEEGEVEGEGEEMEVD